MCQQMYFLLFDLYRRFTGSQRLGNTVLEPGHANKVHVNLNLIKSVGEIRKDAESHMTEQLSPLRDCCGGQQRHKRGQKEQRSTAPCLNIELCAENLLVFEKSRALQHDTLHSESL